MSSKSFVFNLSCLDRPGIVASISGILFRAACNIVDAQQFDDSSTGRFFARVVFETNSDTDCLTDIRREMADALDPVSGMWSIRDRSTLRRVMILVSRFDHCLVDLVYRWKTKELGMDLAGVISNYPRQEFPNLDLGTIPFHYLPVTQPTKLSQEARIAEIIRDEEVDLVVLARYMQILSDGFASTLKGRCINIHHSFLPGFKGARPYHQAHERGVKLIGATAHYVTGELDEGPIIEQDVERISHRDRPEDLVRKGRDIERRVLARAVRSHLEDRVFLNGGTTVVFPE